MNLDDLPESAKVFLDANILVYHFAADQVFGPACCRLMERIERRDVEAVTTADIAANVAHRLMTIEAIEKHNLSQKSVAVRLKRKPAVILQLQAAGQAIQAIASLAITVLPLDLSIVQRAITVSRQEGLLMNDALVVVAMREHGISILASNDADFDRVQGIIRYAPV
jgi:predicted nucleic acid-binding protein